MKLNRCSVDRKGSADESVAAHLSSFARQLLSEENNKYHAKFLGVTNFWAHVDRLGRLPHNRRDRTLLYAQVEILPFLK